MALDTPEGTVYRGVEGTGDAQIFGTAGNPMRAYYARKQDVQRKEAISAELSKQQKEKRDKRMWDMINVDPEKAFEPFNRQVTDAADQHRKKIADYFEKGGNPDDPTFQRFAKKGWDEVNDKARRANYLKQVIDDTQKTIKENPYLQSEYYFPKIWDHYMDEKGNGKNLEEVDPVAIQNIYTKDPMGFNETKYQKDFMAGLNDNMSNYVTQTAANNGILTKDIETKWKGSLYTPDPQSPMGVKTDANGKPILNITTDFINSYTNSDAAARYYQSVAQQQGVPVDEVIKGRIANQAGLKQDVKPSFSRDSNWYYDMMRSGMKPDEKKLASRVFDNINNITNAFWSKDGERLDTATPESRAAVGHFIGTKYGSGTITEADLVPGTNKPGKSKVYGKDVENSPNDRLVFKVKSGTKGLQSVETLDLTDEGAPSTLWNNYLNGGYMGKKSIAFDNAADELGVDPKKLYKGREYLGENQQREQAKINSYAEGKDYGDFTNKSFDGSKIVGVDKQTKLTFSHPIDGEFTGYKLKLANGKEVEVAKDDYNTLTKIHRSKTVSNDGMVDVISPDGKKGKIPADKLEAAMKAGYKKSE